MMTDKIKKFILPNLPYAGMFWLFNKCGEAYRISTEPDTLRKLMDTIGNLNAVLQRPLPSVNPFEVLVGLIGAATIFGIVWYKKKNAKNWRKDVEYGSARFGNKKDIEPYVAPKFEDNLILTATESLMLEGRPKNPKFARNKNVLVVGGSGSGKTRFFLKPNLMQMHSSYCITDPKGVRPDRA
jgi:type IV secretion system protein VirD4